MLSDPTLFAWATALAPTYSTGTVSTFRKIANGKFTSIDGLYTADQPAFLSIRQKTRKIQANALAPVEFTVRYEQHFNVPAVNGIAQSDVPLVYELRVISVPSMHNISSLQLGLNAAAGFTQQHLARLQSGESI